MSQGQPSGEGLCLSSSLWCSGTRGYFKLPRRNRRHLEHACSDLGAPEHACVCEPCRFTKITLGDVSELLAVLSCCLLELFPRCHRLFPDSSDTKTGWMVRLLLTDAQTRRNGEAVDASSVALEMGGKGADSEH